MAFMNERDGNWKNDEELKNYLENYVKQNLKRTEVLDFVSKKYPMYAWSLRTLCHRLSHFEIKYIDYQVELGYLREAVEKEVEGPGRLLGYQALRRKIREIHNLNVPRNLVYAMMEEVDPEGLEERSCVGKRKRPPKGAFSSKGSDWTMSLDGHDKLCGYQKATFPLCVYGGLDTYSGRIQFLRIWTSNNNPKIVGRYYLEYLLESGVMPSRLRLDKGTETVDLATMHLYLVSKYCENEDDAANCVIYRPSTENKIERWWKELLERLEIFFKEQLSTLVEDGDYDRDNSLHRNLLAYVYIPVVQRELDIFRVTVWNNHRGRKQEKKELPTGVPEHIYNFPERYGGSSYGYAVQEKHLQEVAELSEVLEENDDYLGQDFRRKCAELIPDTSEIDSHEAANAYLYLKVHLS